MATLMVDSSVHVDSMVVLKAFYPVCALPPIRTPLCALVDSKQDCALLTLGRSVIWRYNFSEQKQLSGWTSKDSITAPVVYDANEQFYVGVFNDNTIKTWKETDLTLDNIKKIKFNRPIFKLLTDSEGKSSIVFTDGSCASLTYGIFAKKNLEHASFLEKDEVIIDAELYRYNEDNFICFITKKSNEKYSAITCQLQLDINTLSTTQLNRIDLNRDELTNGHIIGCTISVKADPPQIHALWSDGRLSSLNLIENTSSLIGVVPWISREVKASLVWIGDNHIGIYTADSANEGAILVIFNTLFGVCSCKYPLKLYHPGARIWCLPDNLMLESNQKHIAVLQYSLSSQKNILSLLGSNKNEENETSADLDWGCGPTSQLSNNKWNDLFNKGVPERNICAQVILPLLEKYNTDLIEETLDDFKDIPENIIVSLIIYIANNIKSDDVVATFKANSDLIRLLNKVLSLPFISEIIIPILRRDLNIDNTVILLQYINYMLSDSSGDTDFSFGFERRLLAWAAALIDSHFQEVMLSKNDEVVEIFNSLKSTVDNLIGSVNMVPVTLSLLNTLDYKADDANVHNSSSYSIEELTLF